MKKTYVKFFANANAKAAAVPLSVTASVNGGVANIRIIGLIAQWSESNATQIGQQIDAMISQGVTNAKVYIRSQGGDVFEANEMAIITRRRRYMRSIRTSL